jgi:hypothetical protein
MLAQHRPAVLGPKQAASLQDRHHFTGEHVELRRQYRRHDVEPVGGAVGEPVLDQIGDLFRGAGGNEMATRSGQILRRGFRHSAVNTASACRAAKRRPVSDDPACTSTGLP